MGATHFLTRMLKQIGTEMSLQVLAYNMKRVIAILGAGPLMQAIRARQAWRRPLRPVVSHHRCAEICQKRVLTRPRS